MTKPRLRVDEDEGFTCGRCKHSVIMAEHCPFTACSLRNSLLLPTLIKEYEEKMGKKKHKHHKNNFINFDYDRVLILEVQPIDNKNVEIESDLAEDDVPPKWSPPSVQDMNGFDESDPRTWHLLGY
jgi:hypothetical protein